MIHGETLKPERATLSWKRQALSTRIKCLISAFLVLSLSMITIYNGHKSITTSRLAPKTTIQQQRRNPSPTNNDDCNNEYTPTAIPTIDLGKPYPKLLVIHPGKSGGGYLKHRVTELYQIYHPECHPRPCPFIFSSLFKTIKKNNHPFVALITIRDPVDRFLSAFYWRLKRLCNPDGDNRTRTKSPKGSKRPDIYCQKGGVIERTILFKKYEGNASLLAEGLCDNTAAAAGVGKSQKNKKKETGLSSSEAARDLMHIGHLHSRLIDWLPHGKWKRLIDNLAPVILERGYDYDKQIDDAMEWAMEDSGFENRSAFAARRRHVRWNDCQKYNITTTVRNNDGESFRHSSKTGEDYRGGVLDRSLTPLGEACVAQYYAEDYVLLSKLKDKACKTNNCQDALQSILDRRSHLLHCHDNC